MQCRLSSEPFMTTWVPGVHRFIVVRGQLQRENNVVHVIARQLQDYSHWLGKLNAKSRDFH